MLIERARNGVVIKEAENFLLQSCTFPFFSFSDDHPDFVRQIPLSEVIQALIKCDESFPIEIQNALVTLLGNFTGSAVALDGISYHEGKGSDFKYSYDRLKKFAEALEKANFPFNIVLTLV